MGKLPSSRWGWGSAPVGPPAVGGEPGSELSSLRHQGVGAAVHRPCSSCSEPAPEGVSCGHLGHPPPPAPGTHRCFVKPVDRRGRSLQGREGTWVERAPRPQGQEGLSPSAAVAAESFLRVSRCIYEMGIKILLTSQVCGGESNEISFKWPGVVLAPGGE